MPILHISDLNDPRVAMFRDVADPELMRRHGLFVAEGRLVVKRLLESRRFRTEAVLLTETVLPSLGELIDARIECRNAVDIWDTFDTMQVFVTPPGSLELVGGFNFHRGCLALGARPFPPPTLADLALDAPGPRIVLGLQSLANADNVGSIFRNAAAFGVHAIVLDARSCDPLYRKATRTSMGATLAVPFAISGAAPNPAGQSPAGASKGDWHHEWHTALYVLRRAGYSLVALTPAAEAIDIADAANAPALAGRRIALLVGSEGAGLDDETLARADFRVAIRMAPGVDSLNVATATGIALHRLARLS
jgi:tRNA G18 (ribose-2'-O)-methylase SpoU